MTTEDDILIVGGGVIGLSIARELHKRGVERISVLDAGPCGGEASWAAAGMLGPQCEADEGGAFFDLCISSRDLYPALAEELLDETGVDIELDRAGTLYLAFTDDDILTIRRRYEWQSSSGLAVEHLSANEVRSAEPFMSPDVLEALYFPGDWQVDNRKLCTALRRFCHVNGITIRAHSRVNSLVEEGDRVTGVNSQTGSYKADEVVIAAGAWTSELELGESVAPVKVEPIRGQMITMHTAKRLFERVAYSSRGYLVPRRDGRILAGSTTEKVGFNPDTTDEAVTSLFTMACGIAPSLANLEIADRWAGLRPRSEDGLPIIGRIKATDGLYLATGHYRNGILLAPVTARLAAEGLLKPESASPDTFGPERFRLKSALIGF
jgi:glycine oxidase